MKENDTKELMSRVRGIRIFANRLVDDRLAGGYRSSFKGQGLEFDEIRAYEPGDDVRTIDWNVTARTGFAQVKRFVEERQLTVVFLVDVSGSQSFGSGGATKAERAAELCCLLSLVSLQNRDDVGLVLFSDRIVKALPPRKGRGAAMRIVREVLAAQDSAAGGTDLKGALEWLGAVQRRRAVVFVASDFQCEGWQKAMSALSSRHDVVCCAFSDPAERELPAAGLVEFEDPETGEEAWVDLSSAAVRREWALGAAARREALAADFRRCRVDSMFFGGDSDPAAALRRFFHNRAVRRGRRR
ncbi:MAG: DUF58 domain-containing protein [Kiritimatiellae bacterium]|nr:DUF58 domain-containing protein [Kiritimatiellia bacterium]